MIFFRIIFSGLFILSVARLNAQEKISVKAKLAKNIILIGEPVTLTVELFRPSGSSISFPEIDTIPHFEISGEPKTDSVVSGSNTTIRRVYQLTGFDSGHWVIPSFFVSKSVKTDTIGIDVVFSEFNAEQDYHDIKDIIQVESSKKKQWWWWAAGGVLLLGLSVLYLRKKKKPVEVVKPAISVSPFEEAMEQLSRLQENKPDSKQFHTRLAEIFRLYIFRKKGILSLQKTTDDLIVQMKTLNMNKEQYDKLSHSLRLGDFVKFAKYIPTDEDDMNCFNAIRNTIMNFEKLEAKASL